MLLYYCHTYQSPISVSLLKLDPTNLQLNKLAVDCFLSELAALQNNQCIDNHNALHLDIMKFMGDYMSKGKSEKELVITILKVWNHYSLPVYFNAFEYRQLMITLSCRMKYTANC